MQLGLETDVANRNFAGSQDPDAALYVRFSVMPVQNNFKTVKEGRPIFEDVVMIEITTPGIVPNQVVRPMVPADKVRFPKHWAFFQNAHSEDGMSVGTPLSQWPRMVPSQVEMLKAVGFRTVEAIATASDLQLQAIGMAGGMAPPALRDAARIFLQSARSDSAAAEMKAQIAERDKALADMAAKHATDMAELRALIQNPPRRKPGRKPKAKVEAEAGA